MQYLIMFFTITIISIVIALRLKIRTEQAIPITVIGMIIIVYLTGIIGNLEIGIILIYIILLISIIYMIYYLIKNRKTKSELIKKYLSPAILIYGILYILFVILNSDRIFENYDEFNHWGLIIKDMYQNNNFAFSRDSVTLFNEYPPFTAVFEYILLKFSTTYSEDTIIIANNILSISILMPLLKKVNWDKSIKWIFIITLLIVCLPFIVYKNCYFNILVDVMIGILIAYIFYQWFNNHDNKIYRNISTGLGIIAIMLIKSSGIAIASVIILILFINSIRKKKYKERIKDDIIVLVTIFCISLILLGFWKFNIQKNNQNENWDMDKISFQNIIDILKGKEPEGKEGFTNSYFKSIFTRSTITERNLTIFAATLLIMAINIYVYNKIDKEETRKEYKYYSIALYIFEIVYLIYMLFIYLFLFNVEETMAFSSFERYFGTIFLGIIVFHISVGIEESNNINYKNIVIALCILIAFLPLETIEEKIVQGKQSKIVAMTDRKTYIKILNYKDKLSVEDKIFYIDTTVDTNRYSLQIAKYQMIPIKLDNKGITENIDKWREMFQENNYTYVYIQKANDTLKKEFEKQFNEKVEEETMYKINIEEDNTSLIKVE